MSDLLSVDAHFKFGENWQSFLDTVDERSIAEAERGLNELFGPGTLRGKRFLDIGCGSGLSLLAAARLGASRLTAIDIDPDSVEATRRLMTDRSPTRAWNAQVVSVFDLDPVRDGVFDVVHSWGVLHHTGDMWRAVRTAAALVAPGGVFAIALYKKTPFCDAWRAEKRLYAHAPRPVQAAISGVYKSVWFAQRLARGRDPVGHIRNYRGRRGMDWSHDVHDWLGGYPYESASPDEVRAFLGELGLEMSTERVLPKSIGLLGTGCDEYVARRPD